MTASTTSKTVKNGALVGLVVQTTSLVLLLRYSRTRTSSTTKLFINSTAIVMSEIVKSLLSALLVLATESDLANVYRNEMNRKMDFVKLAVPALLYTLQNNLLYVALSNLDAATYQITYQFKILTTALFSVILLHKKLTKQKWIALLILAAGVALVQYPSGDSSPTKSTQQNSSRIIGLVAVALACLSSGFAGVFFEKMMKMPGRSVWVQNFYLAIYSTIIGYVLANMHDGTRIRNEGFFVGYDSLVWLIVLLQAIGGLVVAAIIRYADNIVKGFAASLSIIVSSLASYFILGDLQPNFLFAVGTILVIVSIFMYGMVEPKTNDSRNKKTLSA